MRRSIDVSMTLITVLVTLFTIALFPVGAISRASSDTTAHDTTARAPSNATYLGFDRNIYPGDDALPILRKTFSFAGYWLSPPPGEKTNTWLGKRELLSPQGFGFLLLFRGQQISELQKTWSESRFNRADRLQAQAEKRA